MKGVKAVPPAAPRQDERAGLLGKGRCELRNTWEHVGKVTWSILKQENR